MNKVKRLLALVVLMMFMFTTYTFSVSAAGAFSDVDPSHQYAEAIQKLYEDKIVDGYLAEDGSRTFMPENTITRAEFAKLLAVSLVPDQNVLVAAPTGFADVDKDEKISWAIPYISYAVQSKIVSGYPDGTFQPFKEVTYAEAVKMVVCALGYGPQIEVTDPWYEGYLKMGRNVGATDNAISDANSPSKRGLVAQLIMNLKSVQEKNSKIPIVLPDLGGSGNGGGGGTLILPEEDETYEDDGQITALFEHSLSGRAIDISKNEIMIDNKKYTMASSLDYNNYIKYLGYECEFEYTETSRKKTIQKIKIKDDYTIYELKDADLIEEITSSAIEFYKKETDKKTTKLKLSDVAVIYNGYGVSDYPEDKLEEWLDPSTGTVKLLDNDDNKTVDVAYVDRFDTYFVGAVAIDTYTITDQNLKEGNVPRSIVLDPDDNVVFKTDKNADSAISAIKKNATVLSVFGPYGGPEAYPGLDTSTTVIISKTTIKGAVTSYDSTTDKYTIGGKEYKASPYYNELLDQGFDNQKIDIGDSATFYLDHLGRIVYVSASDTSRYGYITSIEIPSRANKNEYIISMVTNATEGAQTPSGFTLRDKVTINGKNYNFDEVTDRLRASADIINSTKDDIARNAEYAQPIIFKTTVDGGSVIKSITTVPIPDEDDEDTSIEYEKGVLDDETARSEYSSYVFKKPDSTKLTMKFGSTVTNPTKVFVVPNNRNDIDDYAVYTKSAEASKYFIKGNTYLVEGFNVSTATSSNVTEIIVVYGATPLVIDGYSPAYLVRARNKTKNVEEDEDAYEFEMYELGKKAPELVKRITLNDGVGSDIKAGDIIKFAMRGSYIGAIEKVFVDGELYEPFNGEDVEGEQDVAEDYRIDESYSETVKYFTSFVGIPYEIDGNVFTLYKGFDAEVGEDGETFEPADDSLESLTVGTSTYVYIFDGKEKVDQRVKFANTDSVYAVTAFGLENASRVYAYRISGGTIRCIVAYKNADF